MKYADASTLCRKEQLFEALNSIQQVDRHGVPLSRDQLLQILQECTVKHNIVAARHVHSLCVSSELDQISLLGNHLIRLFASCGSLLEVNQVFCRITDPTVLTWSAILAAHVKVGEDNQALELYNKMQDEGINPDRVLYLSILKACSGSKQLEQGRLIHDQVIDHGFESDVFIGSTIIDMYSKCCNLEDAQKTFDQLASRNMVSWHAMISGYVQNGLGPPAIELFNKMQEEGTKVDSFIFPCVCKACGITKELGLGRQLHERIRRDGFLSDLVIGNALVDMYCKCASLEKAREVFDEMPNRTVISWTTMIGGYAQHGHGTSALEIFEQMLKKGIFPERATFLSILKAFGTMNSVELGRSIHAKVILVGLDLDVAIANTIVDIYAKCGSLGEAHNVFDRVRDRNLVSWGAMIAGHSQHGHSAYALDLFMKMQEDEIEPDDVMYATLLKACSNLEAVQQGKLIHDQMLRGSCNLDVVIENSLVDMYAKCGWMEEAQKVFESMHHWTLVSWGSIIAGLTRQGWAVKALSLFEKMQEEGLVPDKALFICALQACGISRSIQKGQVLQKQVNESEFRNDLAIGNALVDMYAKCGALEEAVKVFNDLVVRDETSWGTILTGHNNQKADLAVLKLFERMQEEKIQPNRVIFPCILKASGNVGSLKLARLIHDQIIRSQLESDLIVANSLVDMYTKCGSSEEAHALFDAMETKDQASWSSLIGGYANKGNLSSVLGCLKRMKQHGSKPSSVLFVRILGSCSQAGLVEEARQFFTMMTEDFCLEPSLEHYNCMVDLLGRAGSLSEAMKLIEAMPMPLDLVGWMSLLNNCRAYGEVELGRLCLEQVMQLDPSNAAGLMLMSNMYMDVGMLEDANRLQEMQRELVVERQTACHYATGL